VRRCAASQTRACGEEVEEGEEEEEEEESLSLRRNAVLPLSELVHCVLFDDLPSPHTRCRRCLE
jgi:hypothetical protein